MNSFVHTTLVVELQAGDTERFPVLAHLSYDPSDPFAVTAVFTLDGRVPGPLAAGPGDGHRRPDPAGRHR